MSIRLDHGEDAPKCSINEGQDGAGGAAGVSRTRSG